MSLLLARQRSPCPRSKTRRSSSPTNADQTKTRVIPRLAKHAEGPRERSNAFAQRHAFSIIASVIFAGRLILQLGGSSPSARLGMTSTNSRAPTSSPANQDREAGSVCLRLAWDNQDNHPHRDLARNGFCLRSSGAVDTGRASSAQLQGALI